MDGDRELINWITRDTNDQTIERFFLLFFFILFMGTSCNYECFLLWFTSFKTNYLILNIKLIQFVSDLFRFIWLDKSHIHVSLWLQAIIIHLHDAFGHIVSIYSINGSDFDSNLIRSDQIRNLKTKSLSRFIQFFNCIWWFDDTLAISVAIELKHKLIRILYTDISMESINLSQYIK